MSLFSSKKKLIRDRLTGLSFRWRGGGVANRGGYLIAFALALGAVLFLTYGVKIETPRELEMKNVNLGQITFISSEHKSIQRITQFSSPFPSPWYPSEDKAVLERIFQRTHKAQLNTKYNPMPLAILPKEEVTLRLPSTQRRGHHLPELSKHQWKSSPSSGTAYFSLNELPSGLRKHFQIPDLTLYKSPKAAWNDRGKQANFLITLSLDGSVNQCIPLDDMSVKGAETWLRSLKFGVIPQKSEKKNFSAVITIYVEVEARES